MSEPMYQVIVQAAANEWNENRYSLSILRKTEMVEEHFDCGEPEDNMFSRDWDWIAGALEMAYEWGREDGRNEESAKVDEAWAEATRLIEVAKGDRG